MEIIDSQVHVWRENSPLKPAEDTHIDRSPEQLIRDMDEAGVSRAIINVRSWERYRNEIAWEAAGRHPDRLGVAQAFDLTDERAVAALHHFHDQPQNVCIRLNLAPPRRKYLYDGTDDKFWPAAEEYEIPVMITCPGSLERYGEIVARYPRLKLIVDHMGFRSGGSAYQRSYAVAGLVMLSVFDNVYVKVSKTPNYASDPYPFTSMFQHIRTVVDAFGPKRCFWGTDLSGLSCSYRQAVTMFTETMEWKSNGELEYVMGGALSQALNWPPKASSTT